MALDHLVSEFVEDVGILGPLTISQFKELSDDKHAKSGRLAISDISVSEFMRVRDKLVDEVMNDTGDQARAALVWNFIIVYATACDRITLVAVPRDGMNDVADGGLPLPPVLPYDLAGLRAASLLRLMVQFSSRLNLSVKPHYIITISNQHKALISTLRSDSTTRTLIESFDGKKSFAEAWKLLEVRFLYLVDICSGLTTVFPGTSTVESDFSVLRW